MIISASRRTDIPAFYSEWLMNRLESGYCTVPNPFNPNQISYVSLIPQDVDVIVFWTRNPRPMFKHLKSLDTKNYPYYFLYTLMNNPHSIDPLAPRMDHSLKTFKTLVDRVGPHKVIWRYDPILFSNMTDVEFHKRSYATIAKELQGYTFRSVISIADIYRKVGKRIHALMEYGIEMTPCQEEGLGDLMRTLADAASENGMEIFSCAEEIDLSPYGIHSGKCIDDEYIARVFGLNLQRKKDPSQRRACGCVVSKDIGMYDSCLFGCVYCYATSSPEKSAINHKKHDPHSPSLIGRFHMK